MDIEGNKIELWEPKEWAIYYAVYLHEHEKILVFILFAITPFCPGIYYNYYW
jgi:hypothetical protein